MGNSGSAVFPLPPKVTAPDASSTLCHCQFWAEDLLRWISRTPLPPNTTVGATPLSYFWLADQVSSPSAPSFAVRDQRVAAVCDWWTSTSRPESSSAIAGVWPLS
ncbi:hypothetical protein AB0F91_30960 [Amycolatopsis sp. NPDC023774]|uniref:hypothetical protein n=1 Tax=Amycolatopsis sp. NPDC023774 TaxID=3155015 RepID=UPI0033DD0F80